MDEPQISKEAMPAGRQEEYLNSWKRAQADLDNFKKDEKKRAEEFVKFSNETLILEVLDVVANLELAAKHIADEGLKITINQFESLLSKYGVERITVVGQKFDPTIHEMVAPSDDGAGDTLVEIRAGYTMHG